MIASIHDTWKEKAIEAGSTFGCGYKVPKHLQLLEQFTFGLNSTTTFGETCTPLKSAQDAWMDTFNGLVGVKAR